MTVVFTDAFTVGADVTLGSYPSASPNNDYELVTADGTLDVNAANDRVVKGSATNDTYYKIVDASVPTGDQQITALCDHGSGYDGGCVQTRHKTGSECYVFLMAGSNTVEIYRRDPGYTLITSVSRTYTAGAAHTLRFKTTGTTTVSLEAQINATTNVTATDTSADRQDSGPPGIGHVADTGALTGYVDDVSVDNLAGGTTFQKSLSGSTTPSGALTKKTKRTLAGSSTPSATLTDRVVFVRAVAGAVTASGTLAKKTKKAVTGSVTAASVLVRKTFKRLSGSLSPTGALQTAYRTTKSVVGSVTASGTLSGVKIVLTQALKKTRRMFMSLLNRR